MSTADSWLAIVNPAAGFPRSRGSWSRIERALLAAGIAFDVVHTQRPDDGERIARQAVRDGRRKLIAAGGDGSVNEVLNGVMDAGLADTREVTLAVAPTGTGNDWSRSLGIGRDPADIATAVAAARTVLHDVGTIDYPAPGARRRWFINVAGAGLDAYVTARVPRPVPSALTYLCVALRALRSYRAPRFRVEADASALDDRLLLVFVANAQFCGNRMHVAPGARIDDGLLDIVAVRELGLLAALPRIVKLYRGTLLGDPAVRHLCTARVRIDADPPAEIQADGQMAGHTPAEFSVQRQALRVVIRPAE